MILTLLLSAFLTFVEMNCENLFDTRHDPSKQDQEFLPDGSRRWTTYRYWQKLNDVGRAILACSDDLPDVVALCEVENDTVLHDLSHRSLLRNAGYDYLMTESPDVRGVDVAMLYRPARFRPLCYESLYVKPVKGMRPTRDVLYVKGRVVTGDTLHIFIVHAPSRYGGERSSRPFRLQVAQVLANAVDSLGSHQNIIIAGDFNDYYNSPALKLLYRHGLDNVSKGAAGRFGKARASYRFKSLWRSIDHVLASPAMAERIGEVYVNDSPFLLEEDERYGGWKPRRTFNGFRYLGGTSDHLPLVVRFR
ncbi:MAG: endonuclease/exonuclease/phosphatase family protein [Prevotella sp.]|nr:endonuclease/exonuclease/phosphatase family protein [Prevotella sp.]